MFRPASINRMGLFLNAENKEQEDVVIMSEVLDYVRFYKNNGYWKAPKTIQLEVTQIPFGVTWVARHDNIDDFKNFVFLVKERGAAYIQIIGNKVNSTGEIFSEMTPSDYKKLKTINE